MLLIGIFCVLATSGFQCRFISREARDLLEPIELTWWTPTGDSSAFNEVLAAYRRVHPNINIKIRVFRPEEYETELLNALAEDRGPDMFTMANTDVGEHLTKLQPLPPTTKLAYEVTQHSLNVKNETFIEVRELPSITPGQLRNQFLEVVSGDVITQNQVWALPFSMDVLVMFFNRDLLDNAGIPLPPNTWTELQAQVQQLTFQDTNGNLVQSGVGLGRADNVAHAFEILSLLMMQNGAEMIINGRAGFHLIPPTASDRDYNPGPEALSFYTDFANELKEVYTWNAAMPNSIDAFAQGKLALLFGFHSDIPVIEAKRQGNLNFGVAPVPQIDDRPEVNLARYWVTGVSRKSINVDAAWDFIQFASKAEQARLFLAATGQPTALRTLVAEQIQDDNLNPFATELLTSQSWYHGTNVDAARNAFATMIADVIERGLNPFTAAETASAKVSQTL